MDPRALSLTRHPDAPKRGKAPRHKSGDRFLRGPIPMDWTCAAAKATGHGSGLQAGLYSAPGLKLLLEEAEKIAR